MSPAVNPLPLAALVKHTTESIHTKVEDLLLPRLTSIQCIDDYASVLKMFYGYFQPLESVIEQHLHSGHLPDLAERRKATFVLRDLQQIGHATAGLELCRLLPVVTNTAQAFGAMYVLEGSTLGGKVIAKMLAKNQVVPAGATQFFSGYGEQTGTRWKGFLEVLNQQTDEATVLSAATETFSCLKCWMQHFFHHAGK